MIAVIFEVTPHADRKQDYLDIAAELKVHLKDIDGFVSIERFQSLTDPNKILSLSFWRDEAAITQWRNLEEHRNAQSRGRAELFSDYRIRVACVIRDYSFTDRKQVPGDSKILHDKNLG